MVGLNIHMKEYQFTENLNEIRYILHLKKIGIILEEELLVLKEKIITRDFHKTPNEQI